MLARVPLILTVCVWAGAMAGLWAVTSSPVHFAGNLVATYLLAWGLVFLLAQRPRAVLAQWFTLFTVSLGLAIGALELLALTRVIDYRIALRTPIFAPWRNPRYLLDPELVHVRRPHDHIVGVSRGGDIAWVYDIPEAQEHQHDLKYDQHGFRNETDLSQADIAVLGDSFIEGLGVPTDRIVTAVLSRLQEKPVANFGQIGYGPQQELVALKRYALLLRPRVVVWAFFEGNDLKNVHSYNTLMADWPRQSAAFHSFPERSFAKNALLAVFQRVGKPKPPSRWHGRFETREGPVRMHFLYPGTPLSAEDLDALKQTGELLAVAHQSCASQAAQLVVVFVPSKYRVYNGLLRYEVGSECVAWVLNDLPDRLRAIVGGISDRIGFVDLTPAFASRAAKGELLYFLDDSHWSAAGHQLAAEVIHRHLGAATQAATASQDR